jgi:ribosomal protein L11 methylase PrmA
MPEKRNNHHSSFRDNSGFIFIENNQYFRQINLSYQSHYEHLLTSGLYKALTSKSLLITHEEIAENNLKSGAYKIIKPQQLQFISYPYEWSFSMLKDAALLTLQIQEIALSYGMILKDASAYNVQFVSGRPIFIDTLSFEIYREGQPWQAYGQFCRHFLSPIALMSFTDVSLNTLLINHLDGIPLELAVKLLPIKSRFNLGMYMHIFLHAQIYKKYAQKGGTDKVSKSNHSLKAVTLLADNLKTTLSTLKWQPQGTEWGAYYENDVHSSYLSNKRALVVDFIKRIHPATALDLGANNGEFSKLVAEMGIQVLSFDIDPACVELNYLFVKQAHVTNITPLLTDVANPSPAIGWSNQERISLWNRVQVELIMALALIHHLSITNHIPFSRLAAFFATICQYLIIEFVPKTDEKVQFLLQGRQDVFEEYTLDCFEKEFNMYFTCLHKQMLEPSERVLFLMKKK